VIFYGAAMHMAWEALIFLIDKLFTSLKIEVRELKTISYLLEIEEVWDIVGLLTKNMCLNHSNHYL
jgi:hypothetical protein